MISKKTTYRIVSVCIRCTDKGEPCPVHGEEIVREDLEFEKGNVPEFDKIYKLTTRVIINHVLLAKKISTKSSISLIRFQYQKISKAPSSFFSNECRKNKGVDPCYPKRDLTSP